MGIVRRQLEHELDGMTCRIASSSLLRKDHLTLIRRSEISISARMAICGTTPAPGTTLSVRQTTVPLYCLPAASP